MKYHEFSIWSHHINQVKGHLTRFVQEVDVGGAVSLFPVGGDHFVFVSKVFVEVARLEPGVRREVELFDPVFGRVFSVSFGHFGEMGPSPRRLKSSVHHSSRLEGTWRQQTPRIRNEATRNASFSLCWLDDSLYLLA